MKFGVLKRMVFSWCDIPQKKSDQNQTVQCDSLFENYILYFIHVALFSTPYLLLLMDLSPRKHPTIWD